MYMYVYPEFDGFGNEIRSFFTNLVTCEVRTQAEVA